MRPFLRWPRLSIPPGISPGLYALGLFGPLLLGLGIGVQVLVTAIILIGPDPGPHAKGQLTYWGFIFYRPERDIPVYLAGLALTVLLILALTWAWNRRLHRTPSAEAERFIVSSSVLWALAGLGGTASFVVLLIPVRWLASAGPSTFREVLWAVLAIPTLASLLTAVLVLRPGPVSVLERIDFHASRRRLLDMALDILTPLFIVAVVYIPGWRHLAGRVFLDEGFYHWSYFAMGPALGYNYGQALGSDAYAYYGVGWPVLFASISPVLPLSFGTMLHVSVIYGCIYFIGVYFLLRLLLQHAVWASIGVFIAMLLQLFSGTTPDSVLWRVPSSTILRSPMDIWFLIALSLHLRSGRPLWALAAAATLGLAPLFEVDTGFYLAAAFAFYWVFRLRLGPANSGSTQRRTRVWLPLFSSLVAFLVLLLGLIVASRWSLLRQDFWAGWLEGVIKHASGFFLLPLATSPDDTAIALFIVMVSVYMAVIGYLLVKTLHRQHAMDADVVPGCIALYGLLTLVLFVGRSDPANIYHVTIPFSLVSVGVIGRIHAFITSYLRRKGSTAPAWQVSPLLTFAIPYVLLAGLLFALLGDPHFRTYPSLLHTVLKAPPAEGLCLMREPKDVCGLPSDKRDLIERTQAAIERLRSLTAGSSRVAVLDDRDTLFYLGAGAAPWSRYSPLFPILLTNAQVQEVKRQLLARPPDYVFLRVEEEVPEVFKGVWAELRATTQSSFQLVDTAGPFEVWRHMR